MKKHTSLSPLPPQGRSCCLLFAPIAALALAACAGSDAPDDTMEPIGGGGEGSSPSEAAGQAWVGETYLLQVPETHWIQPRGVGDDIGPFVPGFLFRVDAATGDELTLTMGTALPDGTQDSCGPTVQFEGTTSGFPASTVGPGTLPIYVRREGPVVAVNATIRDLSFDNVLWDGATPVEDGEGVITATMDFRELVHLLTILPDPDPDQACAALLDTLSAPCEPCPHDGAEYCLTVVADALGSAEAPDLEEVVAADRGAECADMIPE